MITFRIYCIKALYQYFKKVLIVKIEEKIKLCFFVLFFIYKHGQNWLIYSILKLYVSVCVKSCEYTHVVEQCGICMFVDK